MREPESGRQYDATNKVSETIIKKIMAHPLRYYFDRRDQETLVRVIKRARLGNGAAHQTFSNIEERLINELNIWPDENTTQSNYLKMAIESLNSVAVRYFADYLFEEFKGVHIAEILQRAKATLAQLEEHDQKYFRQAVERVKNETERRIELRKEEKRNRDQMYEPGEERAEAVSFDNKVQPDNREKRQKDRGLTRESAYLFVDYLLQIAYAAGTGRATIKQRAEVVEFLTGYSSTKLKDVPAWFNKEIAKIKESEEISEKIFDDLQMVRKQFESLGLQEIVARIDQDLGENT